MLYAAHQPDLIPYSGFWFKMDKADVFDLKIWAPIPLEAGSAHDSIFHKRVKPEARDVLIDTIRKRYGSTGSAYGVAKFWDHEDRGQRVLDEIASIETTFLWEFNFRLILFMRDLLGIATPIGFGQPVQEGLRGSAGLISALKVWPGVTAYLSGPGARAYMGDCAEFTAAGVDVVWSNHDPVTGDSILNVLFDYEDPLFYVRREKSNQVQEEEAS
jgi:hypothetical protein